MELESLLRTRCGYVLGNFYLVVASTFNHYLQIIPGNIQLYQALAQ
jgi:hypothetical protein